MGTLRPPRKKDIGAYDNTLNDFNGITTTTITGVGNINTLTNTGTHVTPGYTSISNNSTYFNASTLK